MFSNALGQVGRTHEALLGTYALWTLWMIGPILASYLGMQLGLFVWTPSPTTDPFRLAFAPYLWPGSVGWADYLGFLGITLTASALFTALSVVRLRPVCTRDPVRRRSRI